MRIKTLSICDDVKKVLLENGYETLYPPQIEAIKAGVFEGRNVVLASPTASGKTLIAELCILNNLIEKGGKAVYLTPLKALASEKYSEFKKYDEIKKNGEKIRIGISTGDYDSSDEWLKNYDIIICTNEKMDSLLRHGVSWANEIRTIIVDETHLLTEPDRGPTLEVILTKLKKTNEKAQILLLSATIRNAEEMAEWIKGTPIVMDWRPVPLKEGVYYDGNIDFNDGSTKKIEEDSKNPILDISLNTVSEGGQTLIFTGTRRAAVEQGKKASKTIANLLTSKEKLVLSKITRKIMSAGEKTRLSEELGNQVKNGASFHHAGLGNRHRKIVEESFKEGKIKILAATPTLASGVNLPARTVLISNYERYEPGFGRHPISVLEYKQLSGRAGRPKYDTFGESILIAKTDEEKKFLTDNYVQAKPEKIWSKLAIEKVLRPHVLSVVASKFVHSQAELYDFFNETFYAHQYDSNIMRPKIESVLGFLSEEGMITIQGDHIGATRFGRRVSELYIDPLSAVIIRDAFYNRAKILTELSFLHLLSNTPDISPKLYPRSKEEKELSIFAQNHLDEIMVRMPDTIIGFDNYAPSYSEFLSELKCTSVLLDWIDERSDDEILKKYRVEPGDLLRLVQTSEWLLHAMHELAKLFQQVDLLRRLNELRIRVRNGVKLELIPLVQLEGVGRIRARMLYKSGYRTFESLKKVSITSLATVPLIGVATAKKIKGQVGGRIKESEYRMIEEEKVENEQKQRLITEFND
ncbi:DEAD/DEAH box helicase [Candidatus Pacearchaeota archaeon]|nr:DEAD/DEAH box helicase [Candidatus Pacearchaeota archaeon]